MVCPFLAWMVLMTPDCVVLSLLIPGTGWPSSSSTYENMTWPTGRKKPSFTFHCWIRDVFSSTNTMSIFFSSFGILHFTGIYFDIWIFLNKYGDKMSFFTSGRKVVVGDWSPMFLLFYEVWWVKISELVFGNKLWNVFRSGWKIFVCFPPMCPTASFSFCVQFLIRKSHGLASHRWVSGYLRVVCGFWSGRRSHITGSRCGITYLFIGIFIAFNATRWESEKHGVVCPIFIQVRHQKLLAEYL